MAPTELQPEEGEIVHAPPNQPSRRVDSAPTAASAETASPDPVAVTVEQDVGEPGGEIFRWLNFCVVCFRFILRIHRELNSSFSLSAYHVTIFMARRADDAAGSNSIIAVPAFYIYCQHVVYFVKISYFLPL